MSSDDSRAHDVSDDAQDTQVTALSFDGNDGASHATTTSSTSALSSASAGTLSSLSSLLHSLANMTARDLESAGILPPSPPQSIGPSSPTPTATAAPGPMTRAQGPGGAELRELGDEAVWTLSSCKPGNGVARLRDGRTDTFWQSDGVSPHFVSIHFPRKTRVSCVSFYVDYKLDESYTPSRVVVRGGSHSHAMRELCTLELDEPTGWITVQTLVPRHGLSTGKEGKERKKESRSSAEAAAAAAADAAAITPAAFFSPSHPSAQLSFARPSASAAVPTTSSSSGGGTVTFAPLRCHYLQLVVVSSHQSGKDTHVREVKVYGPANAGKDGQLRAGRGEGKENASVRALSSNSFALLHPVFSSIEFQRTAVLR